MSEQANVSKSARVESVMGRRLSPENEKRGVVAIDFPCELGYRCPVCNFKNDEQLVWSEYASFLWCERCNFDYPSALCVPCDAKPEPERPYVNAGRAAAVRVFLETVEQAVARRLSSVLSVISEHKLAELHEAASKGPWKSIRAPMQREYRCVVFSTRRGEQYGTSPLVPADADLIVAARNALPLLLAALGELKIGEKTTEVPRAE